MSFKKKPPPPPEDEEWMGTFCDVVCLLLCFFVLLITVAEPSQSDVEKLDGMFESFSDQPAEQSFTDLFEQMQEMVAEMSSQAGMEDSMSVEETDKGIMLELASSSFFLSGSATFKPEAIPMLEEMGTILSQFDAEDYIVEVEGHTDDAPIKSVRFPSNWELSAGRASSVVRFLVDKGQEKEKMRVAGLADAEPKVPNLDQMGNPIEENRELNRRVVVRIERRD